MTKAWCPECETDHDVLTDPKGFDLHVMGLPIVGCPAMNGAEVVRAPAMYQSDRLEADAQGDEA